MSVIEVREYCPHDFLKVKKEFILDNYNDEGVDRQYIRFNKQKVVVVIDLTPSLYSYHFGLQDVIYNKIFSTLRVLVKSLYNQDLDIEISVMCTRMSQIPLHVIVHSYKILPNGNYKDLIYCIKSELNELHNNLNTKKDESSNIKFNTVLKWSLFTLEMMEKNRLPMVVLITNTVDSFVSSAIYDGLVMQYCANEVSFNVISLCSHKGLRFGLNSDYLVLKEASKATGGYFIKAAELEKKVDKLFVRKIFKRRVNVATNLDIEYKLGVKVEDLLICRLREGFCLWNLNEYIVLGLHCGNSVYIEYYIKPLLNFCEIKVLLVGPDSVVNKVKKRLKVKTVNIKDEEPSFHERISWILFNISETENFACYLTQVLQGNSSNSKLITTNLNIWHRWMDVERFDIITSKSNNDYVLTQGRKKLNEGMKKIFKQFENDSFIEVSQGTLLLGKLIWEGVNKAVLFIGKYCETNINKGRDVYLELKKISGIEVYNKPLGRMIVENISTSMNHFNNPVQSAQTYKPHIEALKSYLLKKNFKYKLLNSSWNPLLIELLKESTVKKGFFFIGNCPSGKVLLLKSQKIKDLDQPIFFQYLLYTNQSEVFVEFYIDPHVINKEDLWIDLQRNIEFTDSNIYKSVYSLDYAIYMSLRKKLKDDDFFSEENTKNKIVHLNNSDDLYCYIDNNAGLNYKQQKKIIRKNMLKILNKFDSSLIDPPNFFMLLNHSVYYTVNVENFAVSVKDNKTESLRIKFYENLVTGFIEISDYSKEEFKINHFVRYLTEESVIIWKLPKIELFIQGKSKLCIEFFECSLKRISFNNTAPVRIQETELSQTLRKNIELVLKIYKSIYNSTFFQLFDEVQACKQCLSTVIKSCYKNKKIIDCSGLTALIQKNWDSVPTLVSSILYKANAILSESFERMDHEFCEELDKYFKKIGTTNLYIFNDRSAGVFFKFGKFSDKISHCMKNSKITLKIYTFPKSQFFWKELQGLKDDKRENLEKSENSEVLEFVFNKAKALVAQQALELLMHASVVDMSLIEQVHSHLRMIPETVELSFKLNLITQNVDYTELIRIELQKNEVFYCRNVADFYYLVSNHTDKNFMTQKEYENEFCDWEYTETNEYWIDFWTFISIEKMNTMKIIFYLPKHLEFEKLNTRIVEDRLKKQIKKLEIRVNQRILLKSLRETGKINSMLLPAESNQEQESEATKKAGSSRWASKKQINLKPAPSSQSLYRLPLYLSHCFPITDHLSKDDALGCLSAKYSIPPFSIDNVEKIFMLVHKQDICLFKFMETVIQVKTNFPHLSKSSGKDTGTVKVRFIKLLLYGIDAPDIDTFNKLKQNIEELLQQVSMARLADLLTKNQKKIMTPNDYQFINGNSLPKLIMHKISPIINNFALFTAMIKQNLLRFLLPFTIQDSTVLVYNFLKIIDINNSKNPRTINSKNNESVNYLGNTFGKALALISLEIFYYDGENISECKQQASSDFPTNSSYIKEELLSLKKYSSLSAPRTPGYYLEIKVSSKGFLNFEDFSKHLDSCIQQSTFEYAIEQILETGKNLAFIDRFFINVDCIQAILQSSFSSGQIEILHYSNWQNIFLLYSQVLGLIEEQLENKVNFSYGICTKSARFCSKNINEIKDQWEQISDETHIGSFVSFSAIIDQDSIQESEIHDAKFYSSETLASVKIKRSIYIYVQITDKTVQIVTYNLSKPILFKIQNAIELHILWTRSRFSILNLILMQKLGLFRHNINLHPKNLNIQMGSVNSAFPNAICLIEIKENTKIFPLESLINPYETVHLESNGEDYQKKFAEVKGSCPLLRYGLNKFTDTDHIKRHGMHILAFLDRKTEHVEQSNICAMACNRWTKIKTTPLDRMVGKMAKNSKIRDEMHLVKQIIQSCHLFFKVNAKFYMKSFDKVHRIQYTVCEVLKQYTEKIMKIGKFEAPVQSEPKSFRKKSYEDLENPVSFIQSFFSSGALLGENKIDIMQSYLKKVIDKSLIIIEISYENSVIVTNGYCIENFYKCLPMCRFEDFEYNGLMTKEMNKLKMNIDPVSILYDVHLRSLSNLLNQHKDNKEISLIQTLNEISNEFKRSPRKSANSLITFNIFYNLEESSSWTPDQFFMFFLLNSKEKGYSHSSIRKSSYVYKKIYELPEDRLNSLNGTQKWCIFTRNVLSMPQNPKELSVKCFILKCDEKRKLKNEIIKSMKQSIEKEFIQMMDEYKELYRRDQLWSKINEQNNNFSFEDFELLLKASKVSLMNEIDERIKYLTSFKNVFTFNCIRYLTEVYYKNSKVFDVGNKVVLLIIYSQKILAQLILNKEEQSLQIFSVMRSVGCSQKEEDDLVTDLINKIIQWLWVRFTTNEKL